MARNLAILSTEKIITFNKIQNKQTVLVVNGKSWPISFFADVTSSRRFTAETDGTDRWFT